MNFVRPLKIAQTCGAFGASKRLTLAFALVLAGGLSASATFAADRPPAGRPTARPAPRSATAHGAPTGGPRRIVRASTVPSGVPVRRPHDPPKIVDIASSAVAAGRPFAATVRTTSNVASVEVRIDGFSQSIPRLSVGRFRFAYDVPSFMPPMMRHGYTVQFIARNVDGLRDERTLPLVFR